ncbi:MAG: diguanylate cyclase [Desulfuromonadales bacterium]|nr:diguanylate cyclase [Desulfuromonadales bacterium]
MKPSVLIIDDSKNVRQQVSNILGNAALSRSVLEASDGIEGFKLMRDNHPDIILCDIQMPKMDGVKFLRLLNTQKGLQDIPIIMITSRKEPESKILCLELGASDYVTKPFDPGELLARVRVQLKAKSFRDRLKESNEKLFQLSHTDPLTGLPNRRQMMEILKVEMDRSTRSGDPLSLVLIDVDDFKRINDAYGHPKGDEVLRSLGETFRRHLRQYDSVARFGGDEFLLILPATDLSHSTFIAERVRQEVAQMVDGDFDALRVTVSLGVASHPVGQVQSLDDLIRKADYALYQAKRKGRNRVVADKHNL